MTGSNLFPYASASLGDSLYSNECASISRFVLILHILSTQVSDTGPMVLLFSFSFNSSLLRHGETWRLRDAFTAELPEP